MLKIKKEVIMGGIVVLRPVPDVPMVPIVPDVAKARPESYRRVPPLRSQIGMRRAATGNSRRTISLTRSRRGNFHVSGNLEASKGTHDFNIDMDGTFAPKGD
jgi:hypothetical protein